MCFLNVCVYVFVECTCALFFRLRECVCPSCVLCFLRVWCLFLFFCVYVLFLVLSLFACMFVVACFFVLFFLCMNVCLYVFSECLCVCFC